MWLFSFLTSPRIADADAELRAELKEFAYDGLVQLALDLDRGAVKRGTWDGCVLSYRRGGAGSVDCDRKGRRGNAFTRFWDAERIDESHVLELVRAEIRSRSSAPGRDRVIRPTPEVPA
jgi:hypothetical protein